MFIDLFNGIGEESQTCIQILYLYFMISPLFYAGGCRRWNLRRDGREAFGGASELHGLPEFGVLQQAYEKYFNNLSTITHTPADNKQLPLGAPPYSP